MCVVDSAHRTPTRAGVLVTHRDRSRDAERGVITSDGLSQLAAFVWMSCVIAWIARVNSVFNFNSVSASWKSWSACACWNADCRF